MNFAKSVFIIFAVVFFSVACSQPAEVTTNRSQPASSPAATSTPDEFAAARQNFEKHCVACHGADAQGGRVEVEGKRLRVPSLKAGHALEHTDEQLVKQITEGDDEMPPFKDKLNAGEIKELVRFIRKEFQGK
jgi:mono/diheme cytochrome c family protein